MYQRSIGSPITIPASGAFCLSVVSRLVLLNCTMSASQDEDRATFLVSLPIRTLAAHIASGSCTAVEALHAFRSRAKRANAALNAVTEWLEDADAKARELDDELKIENEGASSYCYKRYKWLQKSKDKKGERHKRKRLGEEEQAQVDKRITEHVEKHPEMKQAEWHALDKSLGITNQGASSYSYKRHKWLCKADKLGKEKKVAAAAAAAAGATAAAAKPKPKSKPKAKKEEPVPPRRRKKPRIVSA